jgi:hypothetical protein
MIKAISRIVSQMEREVLRIKKLNIKKSGKLCENIRGNLREK